MRILCIKMYEGREIIHQTATENVYYITNLKHQKTELDRINRVQQT